MAKQFDTLVIGSGAAGLMYALRMAESGSVGVVTKRVRTESNTEYAQGGIAAVMDAEDTGAAHIRDTIVAGDGLNNREVVEICVTEGPDRVRELIDLGVGFTREDGELHLTREGGHSARRIVHARDMTGAEVQRALVEAASRHPNIQFFERHHAVDLISKRRLGLPGPDRCLGAYVLDVAANEIHTFQAKVVMLATGGAGKVYRYTSNPDIATGDGIAMAWRVGVPIVNMEFFQFHPTSLYHPHARNFLITEAARGEGGILRTLDGEAFMGRYHELADLAPRDVVARAIDAELKRLGHTHVLLDMTHLPSDELMTRFPGIHAKLSELGIDMRRDPIPVVPAAHYCCGGAQCDVWGRTSLAGLLVAGETSHTGLHGANRLASNSILEALVFAHRAAAVSGEIQDGAEDPFYVEVPDWRVGFATNPDEKVLITHAWDELRRLMWNYVGIVRSNKRLLRAQRRIYLLRQEIKDDYWSFVLTPDLIELRNLAAVAWLVVESAMTRRESRGLHYTVDYPNRDDDHWLRDTVLIKGRRS